MVHNPRDSDDPLAGQLFWSRRGGRDLSAEVDYDRPCPVCGYKLRGMPIKIRCPECGASGGWALDDESIGWDQRQALGAFLSTAATVLFHPHRLARHVWLNRRLNLQAARRFRRIAIAVAAISFSIVALMITAETVGWTIAGCCIPLQAAAIILWLHAVTLEPMGRLKVWSGKSGISQRVQTIAHYFSAAFLLSPVHIAAAFFLPDLLGQDSSAWMILGAIHVSVVALQLWIASIGLGWAFYELIDMPKFEAHMMAMGWVISASVQAAIMLVGVPAMMALMMQHFMGPG